MTGPEPPSEPLRRWLREIAATEAPELLERARARARSRAEALIEDALVEELVAEAARQRDSSVRPPEQGRPLSTATGSPERRPRGAATGKDEGRPDRPAPGCGDANGEQIWWTYCVASADDVEVVPSELEGVEAGTRVELVRDGRLVALVSPVPATEYGDEALRAHLEDLDWLEATARRHEAVLEEALQDMTIVPLRLCTLYRDPDGVRGLLRDYAPTLLESLNRVDACVEWGVKVFADSRAAEPRAPESPAEPQDRRGAAYLDQRRQERVLAERASEVRAKGVEAVHRRVSELAREAVSNPPQRAELHGRDLRMLLNGAYLIERGRGEELRGAVDVLREEWEPLGFVIELTGPWPPYNFVSGAAGVMP